MTRLLQRRVEVDLAASVIEAAFWANKHKGHPGHPKDPGWCRMCISESVALGIPGPRPKRADLKGGPSWHYEDRRAEELIRVAEAKAKYRGCCSAYRESYDGTITYDPECALSTCRCRPSKVALGVHNKVPEVETVYSEVEIGDYRSPPRRLVDRALPPKLGWWARVLSWLVVLV